MINIYFQYGNQHYMTLLIQLIHMYLTILRHSLWHILIYSPFTSVYYSNISAEKQTLLTIKTRSISNCINLIYCVYVYNERLTLSPPTCENPLITCNVHKQIYICETLSENTSYLINTNYILNVTMIFCVCMYNI